MNKKRGHRVSRGSNLKDIILGGQDGLVNVLGVVLAVAAATNDKKIVLIAGLAATFAESISMGAVAYTSSKAARDYYQSEVEREAKDIERMPKTEQNIIKRIFSKKGFKGNLLNSIVRKITSSKKLWVNTLISDELRLSPEEYKNPLKNGWIVGISALVGSFVPLLPFFFILPNAAIAYSVIFSTVVLFAIGAYKARVTVGDWRKSGFEMAAIGIVAAFVGFFIGKFFSLLL